MYTLQNYVDNTSTLDVNINDYDVDITFFKLKPTAKDVNITKSYTYAVSIVITNILKNQFNEY